MAQADTSISTVGVWTRRAVRRATARQRALPNGFIIGSQKAGTTSLQALLGRHPDIYWPERPEVHYFDWSYGQGVKWYRAWFPRKATLRRHEQETGRRALVAEKTPEYLVMPGAERLLHDLVPDARIIVTVREPVDRAFSQWRMRTQRGGEHLSFAAAVAAEAARLAHDPSLGPGEYRRSEWMRHGYLMRSRYAEHLQRWFEVFPREQVLVVRVEDLHTDPQHVVPRLLEHLGVDPHPLDDASFPHLNVGAASGRNASDHVDIDLRHRLTDQLHDADAELQELVGLSYYSG
jgi:hypothetical protein